MSSTPQARTPAKNPARHRPSCRRQPTHTSDPNGTSPVSNARHGPKTPPSSTKSKKKPQLTGKRPRLSVYTEPPPPPPPAPLPSTTALESAAAASSGRRHADTVGPLHFLSDDDEADSVAARSTPHRPSRLLDDTPESARVTLCAPEFDVTRRGAECAAFTKSMSSSVPVASPATAVSLTLSADAPEHSPVREPKEVQQQQQQQQHRLPAPTTVEGALMGSAEREGEREEEEEAEERGEGFSSVPLWSSVKRMRRARSLSTASLLSPADRIASSDDECEEREGGATNGDTAGGSAATPTTTAPTVADADAAAAVATAATQQGQKRHSGAAGTLKAEVAPLPVTPERPVQVRYFRCAKPLLQEGTGTLPTHAAAAAAGAGGAGGVQVVTAAVVAAAGVATRAGATSIDDDTPRSLHTCGAVVQEDSVTCATPSLHGQLAEEKMTEGLSLAGGDDAPDQHQPRVLDMNTTLVDSEDDNDAQGSGEGLTAAAAGEGDRSGSPSITDEALAGEAAAEPAKKAEKEENSNSSPTCGDASVSDVLSATLAPAQNAGCSGWECGAAERAAAHVPLYADSEPSLLSSAASADDSRASCNSDFSSSSTKSGSTAVSLHRLTTAAPAGLPPPAVDPRNESGGCTTDASALSSGCRSGGLPAAADARVKPQQQQQRSPSPARADGRSAESRKRASMSSARGPSSSSYGCTEVMTSPESHQTRHSTPQLDEDDERDEEREAAASTRTATNAAAAAEEEEGASGRLSPSPCVAAARTSAEPADVVIDVVNDAADVTPRGGVAVVPIDAVRVRRGAAVRAAADTEEEVRDASHVAVYHPRLEPSLSAARNKVWKAALASLDTLVEEYEQSLLACVMAASSALWLPASPPTGLHLVNKAARCTSHSARAAPKPLPVPPAAISTLTSGLLTDRHDDSGEGEAELRLLFRLCVVAPSDAARARLCAAYFSTQLQRYVNWVRHLEFEFLYVRMVAVRAMHMLELHERRMICMRRDLGIRDKIELFMLLAPRPRAPTLAGGRGVFSAFRMALHALGGGGDRQKTSQSRGRGSQHSGRGSAQSLKAHGSRSALTAVPARRSPSLTPPPAATAAVAAAPARPPPSPQSATESQSPAVGQPQPLFASERRGSSKYAVPLICELAPRAPEALLSRSVSPPVLEKRQQRTAEAAGTRKTADGEVAEVREVAKDADPPRESPETVAAADADAERHRRVPRPLNKTYSDYYKLVAEKKSGPAPTSPRLHLPQLPRSASRASSNVRVPSTDRRATADAPPAAAAKAESIAEQAESPREQRQVRRKKSSESGAYEQKALAFGQLLTQKPRRSPKRRKDVEMGDGRLRAKERSAPKPRKRTPPPPPAEDDFVNLLDDEALGRFLL